MVSSADKRPAFIDDEIRFQSDGARQRAARHPTGAEPPEVPPTRRAPDSFQFHHHDAFSSGVGKLRCSRSG